MEESMKGILERLTNGVEERDEYLKLLKDIKKGITAFFKSDAVDDSYYHMALQLLLDIKKSIDKLNIN